MARYVFTPEGLKELEKLIHEIKKKLAEVIKLKAETGSGQDGWHDEGFQLALREEMMWNKKLRELQMIYSNAQVIEPEEQDKCVKIGTGVIIEYEDGSSFKFVLDGYVIGSLKNRVSIYSPLGKVLLNAQEGEERILQVGDTERIVKIKKIFPPSVAKSIFREE